MNNAIRIVIVDSRELVRHGLRHMLETEEDMQVVGDYTSAEEALVQMVRLRQDIVLMGTQMPRMNVIEATRSLKRSVPNQDGDVIILAESADYQVDALAAGAASCLLKDITRAELTQAIRQVYRNRHSVEEFASLMEEVVELVIPPPANAVWLLRFMCHMGEILHDDFASIICTVGSWDRDTVITIQPQPTTSASLPILLANIPEVEKVEEESLARGIFSSFPRKLGLLPMLGINLSKRIHITLKEPDMTRQELANVLN